mmetsp:Transcript_4012/g.11197  ORF Transcript_4012/g.11197 Transcript_4012/m.11197 type:complete len:222 (-) Transcript_4012:632-1297(-)
MQEEAAGEAHHRPPACEGQPRGSLAPERHLLDEDCEHKQVVEVELRTRPGLRVRYPGGVNPRQDGPAHQVMLLLWQCTESHNRQEHRCDALDEEPQELGLQRIQALAREAPHEEGALQGHKKGCAVTAQPPRLGSAVHFGPQPGLEGRGEQDADHEAQDVEHLEGHTTCSNALPPMNTSDQGGNPVQQVTEGEVHQEPRCVGQPGHRTPAVACPRNEDHSR